MKPFEFFKKWLDKPKQQPEEKIKDLVDETQKMVQGVMKNYGSMDLFQTSSNTIISLPNSYLYSTGGLFTSFNNTYSFNVSYTDSDAEKRKEMAKYALEELKKSKS